MVLVIGMQEKAEEERIVEEVVRFVIEIMVVRITMGGMVIIQMEEADYVTLLFKCWNKLQRCWQNYDSSSAVRPCMGD